MLAFYWSLGRDIVEMHVEDRWGEKVIDNISIDLKSVMPDVSGLTRRNIYYCKQFYLLYSDYNKIVPQSVAQNKKEIVPQVVAQLQNLLFSVPWGHHRLLIDKCLGNPKKALFYLQQTVLNGWSRDMLLNFISSNLYERQGKALNNFTATLPSETSDLAKEITKDPYNFAFTGITGKYNERKLKDALLHNITKFLIELGTGFAYVGKEYRLQIEDKEKFIDLLFYNLNLITKKEWVLRGDTVLYGRSDDILIALEYDIKQEREFEYKGLSTDEMIEHICHFVSLLWQNHPFREGNTRTTAVFIIKYLRSCGFNVNNDLFADNSWYFHNALVRANYRNMAKGIDPDVSFLKLFFRNLLLGEHNELKNRYMLINPPEEWKKKQEENSINRPSCDQVPTKLTDQVSEPERKLISAIGEEEKSIKQLMEIIGLKHRRTFMLNYVEPAIKKGVVALLYPNSPRHPRQKYKLTVKGLALWHDLDGE